MPPNKLKNKGIAHLKSYFSDNNDQKAISEKFNNISGKTGKYFVPDTLYQKRTARKNRALIPFKHVLDNNLTYDQLNTFKGGVVVEFVNNDFFDQRALPKNQQNEVFKKLKDNLGSDENVSAMIDIRSTGKSSSRDQKRAYDNVIDYLKKENTDIKKVLIQRNIEVDYNGQGNDKWIGYLYYTIKGGQQDTKDSHKENNILSSNVQLFNPSVEYACESVSADITLVLIYFALFSVQPEIRNNEWNQIVKEYRNYLEERIYDGGSLYDYVSKHISLNLKKDQLMDPIQVVPISIDDFTSKGRKEDDIDLTHQISVNKHSYKYDNTLCTLLTPARPTNVFWSKHLSNMMQQDFSLKEYIMTQREIMKKWDEFGIENILEM